jgi:2-(1,2-epoxy-1,2-dihydrophenyl)acetyl-CoA isomerase
MNTDNPSLRVEHQDGLAIVTLTQAARGNPIDDAFTVAFKQLANALHDQPGLRAVLLRGEGKNFSFGGDLKAMYPVRNELPQLVRRWTTDLHMGLQLFWHLPVPIVCAVQGFCMGGGAALMAGCDVIVAGRSARVGSAFAQLGFSCDSGSSVTLTARMGAARARRFVLLTEVLGSAEAQQAGLFDRVVDDDAVQNEALALAARLASGPTLALGQVKRLFLRAGAAQMEAQLADEAMTLSRISGTADAIEGVSAIVEKRKPVFRGA